MNELAKCFIADRITATPKETTTKKANLLVGYKDDVQFNFRSLSTKVTMGIYETIPGYSVKDVVFYSDKTTALSGENNKPTLYAASASIPSGKGTITVKFPTTDENNTDYNKKQQNNFYKYCVFSRHFQCLRKIFNFFYRAIFFSGKILRFNNIFNYTTFVLHFSRSFFLFFLFLSFF